MSDFQNKEKERFTRHQAAERPTDIAYLLTTGRPLTVQAYEQARFPIPDEGVLKQAGKSKGDRVELGFELSWSTGSSSPPAVPPAVAEE